VVGFRLEGTLVKQCRCDENATGHIPEWTYNRFRDANVTEML